MTLQSFKQIFALRLAHQFSDASIYSCICLALPGVCVFFNFYITMVFVNTVRGVECQVCLLG